MTRNHAPLAGCRCRVCHWAATGVESEDPHLLLQDGPIIPGTKAWYALIKAIVNGLERRPPPWSKR